MTIINYANFREAGVDLGQLQHPKDIGILSNGEMFVTSQNSQKILKFGAAGNFISEIVQFGDEGQLFQHPQYIAVDADENIWVTDYITILSRFLTKTAIIFCQFKTPALKMADSVSQPMWSLMNKAIYTSWIKVRLFMTIPGFKNLIMLVNFRKKLWFQKR